MTALVIIIFNFGGESGKQQFQYGKVEVQEEFQGISINGEILKAEKDTINYNDLLIPKVEKGYLIPLSESKDSLFKIDNYATINGLHFKKEGEDYIVGGKKHKSFKGKVMIDGKLYEGAGITTQAFAEYIPFSKWFLTIAVVLFAVSTMISWSYYGLQSWKYHIWKDHRKNHGI